MNKILIVDASESDRQLLWACSRGPDMSRLQSRVLKIY